MLLLHLLFPLISTSVIVNKAVQLKRFLPSKISYEDATSKLQRWTRSSAAASTSSIPNVVKIVEAEGTGLRAADYLIGRWFPTKSKANSACKHGKITLNGHKIYASKLLTEGDTLEIDFSEKVATVRSPEVILSDELEASSELRRLLNYTSHIPDGLKTTATSLSSYKICSGGYLLSSRI